MFRKTGFLVLVFLVARQTIFAQSTPYIDIATNHVSLVLKQEKHHLQQVYLGEKLQSKDDYASLPDKADLPAYSTYGTDNLFTPAIRVTHADGNRSLDLQYVSSSVKKTGSNVTLTTIQLKDPAYPFEVTLYYKAFLREDVIETWTTIRHQEAAPVTLYDAASANLYMNAKSYWLTQFHGDWGKEMEMQHSKLTAGIKVIDSKLGSRADKYNSPCFFLSPDHPSGENAGKVLAGTLAWTGNFRFSFEIDNGNKLHIISGINPFASEFHLKPDTTFTTPAFIFTYSDQGKGQATRNIDRWARRDGLLDGDKPRLTLLNNWETTYFDFNEDKLLHLFDQAKEIGVDMFLLDDGWFGNKYPRNNDHAGLGDWQANKKKLPHGIGYLVNQANKRGVKFGIWIEPEMVNPQSELYEQHPDWILRLPNRPENYQRHQLVLDMSNPAVQDFVFGVIDSLMTDYPGIAYFKWDCNRTFTDAYSVYLGKNQSHLYIEYVEGLYKVFKRMRKKYPHLPMMLCSGGGGRVDYGALPYFTEFWPSDNTNPMDRIFIQWGYSYFFPALATCNHVTESGDYSMKFKIDVAMMGKMGFDMRFDALKPAEIAFVQRALKTYKRIDDIIWFGDLYRLISPYKGSRAALMYVTEDKHRAVVFTYRLHKKLSDDYTPVRLNGLDPDQKYKIEEINLPAGKKSACPESGHTFTGAFLMSEGIHPTLESDGTSAVFELIAE
jgi:alpha-galactosidase